MDIEKRNLMRKVSKLEARVRELEILLAHTRQQNIEYVNRMDSVADRYGHDVFVEDE